MMMLWKWNLLMFLQHQTTTHKPTNLNDMTVEQLLQPRYKVMADYPNSTRVIGQIICAMGNEEGIEYWCADKDKYPHLFRKLEWWEDRDIAELPEYIKSDPKEVINESWRGVYKVEEYYWHDEVFFFETKRILKAKLYNSAETIVSFYLPATVAEYTNYLTTKPN